MKKRPFEQLVPKQRRDVNATWQIGDERKRPPKLGDVELVKTPDGTWKLQRNGATVASGLHFQQVLAVVRGEVDINTLISGGD